jgi:selenocysteine lyase/cysteine desulfurase
LERTKVVPADAAQKILADSQSSGNAKLESEASALASASHVLDTTGTVSALAAMAATCHQVSAGP